MATKAELEEQLNKLSDVVGSLHTPFNPQKHKDETRSKIALFVTQWYFYLTALILVGVPFYNYLVPTTANAFSVKDMLSAFSGATSGIFGFIVGYYFKGSE